MKNFTTQEVKKLTGETKLFAQITSFIRNKVNSNGQSQRRVIRDGEVTIYPYVTYSTKMCIHVVNNLLASDNGRFRKHHEQWYQFLNVFEEIKAL